MSELSKDLQNVQDMSQSVTPSKKVGFHNQANIKAAARGIVLEALTAFKGGKVGKRGLLVRAMSHLEYAFEHGEPEQRQWATEQVLKLANGMTKDDKAGGLDELLKGAANVQINFNSHFSQRRSETDPPFSLDRSGSNQASPAGHGLTIGFTPPPRSGDPGPG